VALAKVLANTFLLGEAIGHRFSSPVSMKKAACLWLLVPYCHKLALRTYAKRPFSYNKQDRPGAETATGQPCIPAITVITNGLLDRLFQLDSRAGFFECLLDLFGFILGSSFLHGRRYTFNHAFRFLQTQAGDTANSLDD